MTLRIDVISDVVCPWCFIGKRKLERAIELYRTAHPEAPAPEVHWLPFQLNPDLPDEGMSRGDYLERKFGSRSGGPGYDRVRAAGAAVGIDFAFERIERQPNTVRPHAAIAAAGANQDALVESLFRGYFLEGADLTDAEAIRTRAIVSGLSEEDIDAALELPEVHAQVRNADQQARAIGVQGVPFFIFNRKLAVSGAHDPQVLVEAMQQSLAPESDEDAGDARSEAAR